MTPPPAHALTPPAFSPQQEQMVTIHQQTLTVAKPTPIPGPMIPGSPYREVYVLEEQNWAMRKECEANMQAQTVDFYKTAKEFEEQAKQLRDTELAAAEANFNIRYEQAINSVRQNEQTHFENRKLELAMEAAQSIGTERTRIVKEAEEHLNFEAQLFRSSLQNAETEIILVKEEAWASQSENVSAQVSVTQLEAELNQRDRMLQLQSTEMDDFRRNMQHLTSERNYAENEAARNAQVNDRIALEAESNDASAKRYMDESQAYMKGQEHHLHFEKNVIASMEVKERQQQEELAENAAAMSACMAEMKLMRKKMKEMEENQKMKLHGYLKTLLQIQNGIVVELLPIKG